jgi:membrane-bound metal-dependent hydrolase YbcI (DUF457 family)
MLVGHYAVAFGGKRLVSSVSLGTLFLATQFLDLLWPVFMLLGLEHVRIDPGNTAVTPLDFYDYPYTHSLAAAVFWALLFAVIFFWKRRQALVAAVLFFCVMSHWLLDYVSHRPDLPLWPGNPNLVGLGLWNSLPGTMLVELGLYALGIHLYLRATDPRVGKKTWGPWGLVATLLLIQITSYLAPLFDQLPPDEWAVMQVGFAQWFLVPWAYWVDRRRTAKAFRSDALFRLGADEA